MYRAVQAQGASAAWRAGAVLLRLYLICVFARYNNASFALVAWRFRSCVPLSDNHIRYFISYAVAFLGFSLIAKWYLWPAIKDRVPKDALTPILLYACLRVNGLMFLMPGLVSRELPRAFAVPTAYGDLTAALLALLTLWPLRTGNAVALPMVWIFNVVGLLDLVYANISTFKDHVDPTYLGVSYYLAALNVPAMVVVHFVIFAYLLRRRATP
jgi:hypothetical protein